MSPQSHLPGGNAGAGSKTCYINNKGTLEWLPFDDYPPLEHTELHHLVLGHVSTIILLNTAVALTPLRPLNPATAA